MCKDVQVTVHSIYKTQDVLCKHLLCSGIESLGCSLWNVASHLPVNSSTLLWTFSSCGKEAAALKCPVHYCGIYWILLMMLAWSCWILLDCSKLRFDPCDRRYAPIGRSASQSDQQVRRPGWAKRKYQDSILTTSNCGIKCPSNHLQHFQHVVCTKLFPTWVNRPVCQWTPATSYWSPASMTTYFFLFNPAIACLCVGKSSRLVKSCSPWPAKHPWQLGSWPDIIWRVLPGHTWSIDSFIAVLLCYSASLHWTHWTCSSLILWQRQRSAWVSLSILASCVSRRWVVSDIILAHQCSLRSFPLAGNDAFHTNGPSQKCLQNDSIVNSQ